MIAGTALDRNAAGEHEQFLQLIPLRPLRALFPLAGYYHSL